MYVARNVGVNLRTMGSLLIEGGCRNRQRLPSSGLSGIRLFWTHMKKINHASKEHRLFRRSVRKLFAGLIKRKELDTQTVLRLLREIEQSIELMVRRMGRTNQRRK